MNISLVFCISGARRTYVLTSYTCLAPVCFDIRVLHDRMRAVSSQTLRTLWNHHDSCLMSLDRSAPTSGHPHRVFLHGGAKSICYSSITDLRNTAFISILDNFSLDHCHWVSHSESNTRPFCIKLLAVPPKVESDHSSPPFSSSLLLWLPIIDSVHVQRWALATALLPLPFPASSLSLWPSSHRFCLCSTLGSGDCSSRTYPGCKMFHPL